MTDVLLRDPSEWKVMEMIVVRKSSAVAENFRIKLEEHLLGWKTTG